MSTQTLIYDRRKRQERQTAKARAEREKAHAELTEKVKAHALRLAVEDPSIKSRMTINDITVGVFDELSVEERISILEDYIAKMRKLGSRLLKEYGSNGKETTDEIKEIEDLIDEAAKLIVRISIKEVHESFVLDDDDDLTNAERQQTRV